METLARHVNLTFAVYNPTRKESKLVVSEGLYDSLMLQIFMTPPMHRLPVHFAEIHAVALRKFPCLTFGETDCFVEMHGNR